jgi:hypothetical protein
MIAKLQIMITKSSSNGAHFPLTSENNMKNEIRKDHSVGAGTGAVAGAIAGATIGSVVGPIGTATGALIGGIAGAKAGDGIAEVINPTDFEQHFKSTYKTAAYYNPDLKWNDYKPAYDYGYSAYNQHRGHKFKDVEAQLSRNWESVKGHSKLAWDEAKGAVKDGWHHIENAVSGDKIKKAA